MKLTDELLEAFIQPQETVLLLGLEDQELYGRIGRRVGVHGRVLGVDPEASCVAAARQWELPAGPPWEVRQAAWHDLRWDLEQGEAYLRTNPLASLQDLERFEAYRDELRRSRPVVENGSVDVVVAEKVLGRINLDQLASFLAEAYRVLRRGGRMLLGDLLADEDVPARLRRQGNVPSPVREAVLLRAFEEAQFYGTQILQFSPEAVATVEGIEFREALIAAWKGKEGVCLERHQAVIYRGPWRSVTDDDGHTLPRGVRIAVCDKTYQIYARPPYRGDVILIPPREEIPLEDARPFDCSRDVERPAWETKGLVALSRDPLVTVAPKRSAAPVPSADSGIGYIVHVEWRSAAGDLQRHLKVTPRFSAYYETPHEALEASRKLFPDATRHRVEGLPIAELLARKPHGRMASCPLGDRGDSAVLEPLPRTREERGLAGPIGQGGS